MRLFQISLATSAMIASCALLVFALNGCDKHSQAPESVTATVQIVPPSTPITVVQQPSSASHKSSGSSSSSESANHSTEPTYTAPASAVEPYPTTKHVTPAEQAAVTHRAAAAPIRRSLYYSNHHTGSSTAE